MAEMSHVATLRSSDSASPCFCRGERDPTTIKDRALNALGAGRFGADAA
jgi:hypothetical protein